MDRQNIPNLITATRVPLTAVFFVLLGLYHPTPTGRWLAGAALSVFLIAGLTDVIDGTLARRWNATSTFGRMMDPCLDKVLAVGAFMMLAGSNFAFDPAHTTDLERSLPAWVTGRMATGVQAWMVMLIASREFVVSSLRGFSESMGEKFAPTWAGKTKMLLQSCAVGWAIGQLAIAPGVAWGAAIKIILVWLATGFTFFSGVIYLERARRLLKRSNHERKGDQE